jgi:hypothetical protein
MASPSQLTAFQRVCIFLGFLCLFIALAGVAANRPANAAATAFIGLSFLVGSRLTYRD